MSSQPDDVLVDEVWHVQIQMLEPVEEPLHVTTKQYVDAGDANTLKYSADGNVHIPAGVSLQAKLSNGSLVDVLKTDTNGNASLGDRVHELNLYSSARPTVTRGNGTAEGLVLQTDMGAYATEAEVEAVLVTKADLVSGVVPDSQLPSSVKVNNWVVTTGQAGLTVLSSATVNDRAFVSGDPVEENNGTYYLIALPPTVLSNWQIASVGTSGGIATVNGQVGPAVVVDLPNFPLVQAALNEKAQTASLTLYAPINSPTFTGTPATTTPAAGDASTRIPNTAWVNDKMISNLSLTSPNPNGTAASGSSTLVSRADHVHPHTNAGSATTTTAGTAGIVALAPDNDSTSRNRAATPAGVAAQIAAGGALVRRTGTLTTSWSGSATNGWTQTVSIANKVTGIVGPPSTLTNAQYDAYVAAGIRVSARTDTSLTFTAQSEKPVIQLPFEYIGVQ